MNKIALVIVVFASLYCYTAPVKDKSELPPGVTFFPKEMGSMEVLSNWRTRPVAIPAFDTSKWVKPDYIKNSSGVLGSIVGEINTQPKSKYFVIKHRDSYFYISENDYLFYESVKPYIVIGKNMADFKFPSTPAPSACENNVTDTFFSDAMNGRVNFSKATTIPIIRGIFSLGDNHSEIIDLLGTVIVGASPEFERSRQYTTDKFPLSVSEFTICGDYTGKKRTKSEKVEYDIIYYKLTKIYWQWGELLIMFPGK